MGTDVLWQLGSSGDCASPQAQPKSRLKRADGGSRSRRSSGLQSPSNGGGHSDVSTASPLQMSVDTALAPSTNVLCLLLLVVIAVPLLHVICPGHVPPSLVSRHWPAWPGDPLGMCSCHLPLSTFFTSVVIILGPSYIASHKADVPSSPRPNLLLQVIYPSPSRRPRSRSRSLHSWFLSWDCRCRPFAAEQQLLHLRDDSSTPQQEEDQEDDTGSSADNSLSTEAIWKLLADLVCLPELSHYADPFLDPVATNTQLVQYHITQFYTMQTSTGYVYTQRNV